MFGFDFGSRFCHIIHCRLRLGCSQLNSDRYTRFISDIMLHVHAQTTLRTRSITFSSVPDMITSDITHTFFYIYFVNGFSLQDVLCGNTLASHQTNMDILESVHQFITKSNRFSQ